MADENPVQSEPKKDVPTIEGIPPEAQKFADDMVQKIIKTLPPPQQGPMIASSDDIKFLVEQVKALASNQYCDHLILEAIWSEIGMTSEQAKKIDRKVAEEQVKRTKKELVKGKY
jgi:division protein CdvB (Snf7/Vps24/ESCRT-III family)